MHLILEPNRARVDGTVTISGEVTGDCEFSDSGQGTIKWDSNDPSQPITPGGAWGNVSLSMSDPRYMFPDLNTIVLYIGAGIDRRGGTCGHTNGPVFDASPQFSITSNLGSCGTLDVHRTDAGTWTADCTEEPKVEGQGMSTVTVRLAETPATTPTP